MHWHTGGLGAGGSRALARGRQGDGDAAFLFREFRLDLVGQDRARQIHLQRPKAGGGGEGQRRGELGDVQSDVLHGLQAGHRDHELQTLRAVLQLELWCPALLRLDDGRRRSRRRRGTGARVIAGHLLGLLQHALQNLILAQRRHPLLRAVRIQRLLHAVEEAPLDGGPLGGLGGAGNSGASPVATAVVIPVALLYDRGFLNVLQFVEARIIVVVLPRGRRSVGAIRQVLFPYLRL
mmetsp:Transcript_51377/g.130706  ORF Transcript_51377/g.130706 Transcript_51377/m.130706 type:complete len:236 (+) Transcript_51377:27-734(+)